jgi:ferredoxin
VAPAIFELDDDGFSTVVGPVDTAERVAAARMAAQMCPMAAIQLDE